MAISVFDLFKVGIGPSSSHTVGPMTAAKLFVDELSRSGFMGKTKRVMAQMYGSLGATGKGHGTPKALMLGLEGERPETVDVSSIAERLSTIYAQQCLFLCGQYRIAFNPDADLILHRRETLAFHPNGMVFTAFDNTNCQLMEKTYYSVGGGFVVNEDAVNGSDIVEDCRELVYPFDTAEQLLSLCQRNQKSISEIMWENEKSWRTQEETQAGLMQLWQVMQDCVNRGIRNEGILPGGLKVKRRAAQLHSQLVNRPEASLSGPLSVLDWVTLYALAVNEENAAGGRLVTAPTNGAAGIIPAVLHYYMRSIPGATDSDVPRFLLTAAAIGILYKKNASISGAEVGCQGEVGSACSMAAGALAELLGASPSQVENAAEIGMEHNLGLTCDPIGGLVQVPCIERNAVASVNAIHAARLALRGDGTHFVSLDKVIRTMRDTGHDMQEKYKETARGGLALDVIGVPVNIIEC
ncbi:MAG: L-serine ammonia-lyase [Spongiibacteraceae bacterium]|nr:L-serine ammonia-lyase [Spongiibacteraceae bacterium]